MEIKKFDENEVLFSVVGVWLVISQEKMVFVLPFRRIRHFPYELSRL